MEQFIAVAKWSTVGQVIAVVAVIALFWLVMKLRKDVRSSTDHKVEFSALNLQAASAVVVFAGPGIFEDDRIRYSFDEMIRRALEQAGFDGPVIVLPSGEVELAVLYSGLGEENNDTVT